MSNDQAGVRRLDVNEYVMPPQHTPAPQPMMRPAPAGYGEPGVPYSAPPTHYGQPPVPAAPTMPPPVPAASPAAVQAAQGQPATVPDGYIGEITLSREYEGYDGVRLRRVRFKKPGTKDLRRHGYPVRGHVSGAFEELPDVVARYIIGLSEPAVPPAVVDAMEMEDFQACSAPIVRFFLG